MSKELINRRDFLKISATAGASLGLFALGLLDQKGSNVGAKGNETPTFTPEQLGIRQKLLVITPENPYTRYRAEGLFDLVAHTLPSYIDNPNGDIPDADLERVKNAILGDIDELKTGIDQKAVKIEEFGNFGDIVLTGNGRLGVSLDKLRESTAQVGPLMGKKADDGHVYWNASGDKLIGYATLYDSSKKDETQVMVAITSAGRARQAFTAMAASVAAARGGNPLVIRQQTESALGFTSLNGDSGSEFSISCLRTFPHKANPIVYDINEQPAVYIEKGSDLQKSKYNNMDIKVGNAHETDTQDDGKGTMVFSSDETVYLVVKVDSNGKITPLETNLSDNLIENNGTRRNVAAGSEWFPCGQAAAPKEVTKKPVKTQQQSGQPKNPTTPLENKPSVTPARTQPPQPTRTPGGNGATPIVNTPVPTSAPVEVKPPTVPPQSAPSSTPSF